MRFDRAVTFLDIESTGTDVATDRIVEIGLVTVIASTGERRQTVQRFNPGMPIPPAATEVHGITDADVADCLPFTAGAELLHGAYLDGFDLAGYNLARFDIPLLWEELHRAGIKWDLTNIRVFDCDSIFKKKETRTLADAVRKFCGREHVGAHGAMSDASAVIDVLAGQLEAYPDLAAMTPDELAAFCQMDQQKKLDLCGKLLIDADGDAIYNFGKFKGKKLKHEPGYAEWMLTTDFPASTKIAVERQLDMLEASCGADMWGQR